MPTTRVGSPLGALAIVGTRDERCNVPGRGDAMYGSVGSCLFPGPGTSLLPSYWVLKEAKLAPAIVNPARFVPSFYDTWVDSIFFRLAARAGSCAASSLEIPSQPDTGTDDEDNGKRSDEQYD